MELLKEMQQTAREALDGFNVEQPEGPTEIDAIVDALYTLVTTNTKTKCPLGADHYIQEVSDGAEGQAGQRDLPSSAVVEED